MTGESVTRHYMSLRLDHAAELLRFGEKLDSVAEKTGFCSAFNFSRMFKNLIGVSPSEYRVRVSPKT
jgi:transcriptional regulator GlxA family with amidase domain